LVQRAKEMTTLLIASRSFLQALTIQGPSESRQISEKVDKGLERMRRAAVGSLELSQAAFADDGGEAVRCLIEELLTVLWLSTSSVSEIAAASVLSRYSFVTRSLILISSPDLWTRYLFLHENSSKPPIQGPT
jgi:hypothetical protein